MTKFVLTILFSLLMFGVNIASANSSNAVEMIDTETQNVTISVTESSVHVSGGNGLVLSVYRITGDCILKVKVEGNDKRFDLNLPKGCYILKVGKVVRKIVIKQ